jgi:hypothetical protein
MESPDDSQLTVQQTPALSRSIADARHFSAKGGKPASITVEGQWQLHSVDWN